MNAPSPTPISNPLSASRLVFLATCLIAVLPMASNLQGQILADFDDGNTDQEVDGFPGMPGNGWATDWTAAANSGVTFNAEVIDTNPLNGGGNYAHVTMEHDNPDFFRNVRISRQYEDFGSIALDQPHSISFLYRLDSGIEHLNRPRFFDDTTGILGPTGNTTWKVRTEGVEWRFDYWDPVGQTNTQQLTGMDLFQGDVYVFRIDVDPATSTYVGFVENLDHAANNRPGPASFTTDPLRFMNDQTQPHGFLNFVLTLNPDGGELVSGAFSFDTLHIIPEPGGLTLAGLGLAMALGLLARRRRR